MGAIAREKDHQHTLFCELEKIEGNPLIKMSDISLLMQ